VRWWRIPWALLTSTRSSTLFERFLNPERISMPDIDIDFCMNRRGEVIQGVTEKYGRENVAQYHVRNQGSGAIKDAGGR
jgi:DNA polymerase-3 subunit alpha